MNAVKKGKMKIAADFLQEFSKKFKFRLRTYRPHVNITIDSKKYLVKTVENGDELSDVLRLRHDVFYREMLEKKRFLGKDIDKYDFKFDHLAVIDREANKTIGTYRLNCSLFSDKFYSSSEFKMDRLLERDGIKLELGRACIDPEHRGGAVIAALWKGLGAYMKETSAGCLFGCSSVKTTDNFTIALVHDYLTNNFFAPEELRVSPKSKFRTEKYHKMYEMLQEKRFAPFRAAAENLVPPLMLAYFKAGGVICGEPAYDKAFKCYDYLTYLDISRMDGQFKKKFTEKD